MTVVHLTLPPAHLQQATKWPRRALRLPPVLDKSTRAMIERQIEEELQTVEWLISLLNHYEPDETLEDDETEEDHEREPDSDDAPPPHPETCGGPYGAR